MTAELGISAALALVVAWVLTYYLRTWLQQGGLMDVPNQRSSHDRPIPRGGGLGLLAGVGAGLIAINVLAPEVAMPGRWFWVGWGIIICVSILDDRAPLAAGLRFALHALAAGLVLYEQGGLAAFPAPEPLNFALPIWMGYVLGWFWIMAVINIYNFLDGINGFAGTQAVVAGLAMILIDPQGPGMVLGVLVAAGALGFLYFNFGKATIFMGDVGSISLGFLFATLPFYRADAPIAEGVYLVIIVLWFFLADGAFTILRRLWQRKKLWEAHREHYYQELVKAGWSHQRTVVVVMGIATGLFLVNYFIIKIYSELAIFTLFLSLLAMVGYWRLVRYVKP